MDTVGIQVRISPRSAHCYVARRPRAPHFPFRVLHCLQLHTSARLPVLLGALSFSGARSACISAATDRLVCLSGFLAVMGALGEAARCGCAVGDCRSSDSGCIRITRSRDPSRSADWRAAGVSWTSGCRPVATVSSCNARYFLITMLTW